MTPKGWGSQGKLERLTNQFSTIERVRLQQNGLSVLAHQFVREVSTDAVEADSTVSTINATSHSAQVGDVIRITSGTLSGMEVKVDSVTANSIVLAEDLPSAPAALVTFQILRHKYPLVNSDGTLSVALTESATAADGGSLPALLKIIGGYDGTNVQAIKTDSDGNLQVDVLSSALPTGAATETTLAALAAEDFATQTTLAALLAAFSGEDFATETTLAAAAASLSSIAAEDFATQTTLAALLSAFNGTDFATDTTLASAVAALASIAAEDFATETTLATRASETTLAAVAASASVLDDWDESDRAKVNPIAGQAGVQGGSGTVSNNTQRVVLATDVALPAGTNLLGKVDPNLDVIDFLDTNPVLDSSSTNIPASGSSTLEVVASLAAAVKKIKVNDTTGQFIGVYTGVGNGTLQCVIGPGLSGDIEVQMALNERVSIRNMANAAISSGSLCIQFLG